MGKLTVAVEMKRIVIHERISTVNNILSWDIEFEFPLLNLLEVLLHHPEGLSKFCGIRLQERCLGHQRVSLSCLGRYRSASGSLLLEGTGVVNPS